MKIGKSLFLSVPAVLFSFFLGLNNSAEAATITVDGDLSDLIAASGLPNNSGSATEAGNDAENNGFDITTSYSHYDVASDTFFFGFQTQGPVGNSCSPGDVFCEWSQSTSEGGQIGSFDALEQYGFGLDLGAANSNEWGSGGAGSLDAELYLTGDALLNNGPGNETAVTNSLPGQIAWAVSEAYNGVEFSVTGLNPLAVANPMNFTVRFTGGSGHNPGAEDSAYLSGTVVPEPVSVLLLGSGLAGLAGFSSRRKKK